MDERNAVEQLFADYAWAVDTGDLAVLDDVFAEEATYVIVDPAGGTLGPITGLAALREFLGGRAAQRSDERRHSVTNVRLVAGGEDATALLTVVSIAAGELRLHNTGLYRVTLDRSGPALRFASMRLTVDVPA